jgi:hypothetical protein
VQDDKGIGGEAVEKWHGSTKFDDAIAINESTASGAVFPRLLSPANSVELNKALLIIYLNQNFQRLDEDQPNVRLPGLSYREWVSMKLLIQAGDHIRDRLAITTR